MSIYNPPTKTQTIFNPSNYGGLGSGGEITIDYLKSSFVEFPVAQGNTTLVGTNVLGDITQQGDLSTSGDITGETIKGSSILVGTTNLLTEIESKQDELTSGTNISIVDDVVSCDLTGSTNIDITGGVISTSSVLDGIISQNGDDILTNTNAWTSVQTQVDSLIDLFGGGVNFRAYTLSSATFSAGNNSIYDNESYDTENSYDTSTGIYTIVIAGTYVFTLGWYVVSGSTAVVNLIRKRNSVESILQQSTNGTNTDSDSGFFITTIAECETGDEIYAYLDSGACRLIPNDITDPTTLTSFRESRISS